MAHVGFPGHWHRSVTACAGKALSKLMRHLSTTVGFSWSRCVFGLGTTHVPQELKVLVMEEMRQGVVELRFLHNSSEANMFYIR